MQRVLKKMSMAPCVWSEIINDNERIILQEGLTVTGLISVMFSMWLNAALVLSDLRFNRSYRNLANFILAACIRRIKAVISQLPFIIYIINSYGLQAQYCEIYAFLETFLAVLEVECLTHVCIERYVVAKYITNGWSIKKGHYTLFSCLCAFFAALYSFPPLFGVGRFDCDFSCSSCIFDIVMPSTWQRYFILMIFLLRSVKPAVIMVLMLIWARELEGRYASAEANSKVSQLTRSVTAITLANLCCWSPIALIGGWMVFSNLMNIECIETIPTFYIKWVMWIHWISPAVTAITLLIVDRRVRHEMIYFCPSDNDYKIEEKEE